MAKQGHDLGVIKRKNGRKKLSAEELWKERRKRALPRLYPGWDEDRRSITVVVEELKERYARRSP